MNYLLEIFHCDPFLVFTSSGDAKVDVKVTRWSYTVKQKQVTLVQFPSWRNKGTENSHISITTPLGAIKTGVNESLHLPVTH